MARPILEQPTSLGAQSPLQSDGNARFFGTNLGTPKGFFWNTFSWIILSFFQQARKFSDRMILASDSRGLSFSKKEKKIEGTASPMSTVGGNSYRTVKTNKPTVDTLIP